MSDPQPPGGEPNPYAPPPAQPGTPPPSQPPPQGYGVPPQQEYAAPPPDYSAPYPGSPAGYPPPYGVAPGYATPPTRPSSGLAIAALVLGIIAVLGFWIPGVGIGLGLIALIFGIVAWVKAGKGSAGGLGMAITGTILGGLALLGGIAVTIVTVWFVTTTADCFDANLTDSQRQLCFENKLND